MRALIHVNHMLGTGHAFRACRLGKALVRSGVSVTIATGNKLPDTIDTSELNICNLPVLRSLDTEFSQLVDENGTPIDRQKLEQRQEAFWEIWQQTNPNIMITEHFPFGRRKLEFELIPVLDAIKSTKPETLVVSSVRDILVSKKVPEKELRMAEIAKNYFDMVLVHSDHQVVRLDESFRYVKKIQNLIHYSGFLHPNQKKVSNHTPRKNDVVVSAGGGAFGMKLIKTAIESAETRFNKEDYSWRIFCGPNISKSEMKFLSKDISNNIKIENNRPDFQEVLSNARCSISQAGYNTVLDTICAGIPAVLIPSPVNENEQVMRARILAKHGCAELIEETELTSQSLAIAVKSALSMNFKPLNIKLDDGSECSKQILDKFQQKQRSLQKS